MVYGRSHQDTSRCSNCESKAWNLSDNCVICGKVICSECAGSVSVDDKLTCQGCKLAAEVDAIPNGRIHETAPADMRWFYQWLGRRA